MFAITATSGCLPFGTSQEIMQFLEVTAIALPDFEISESQLAAHPGAVPYNIHLFVDPSTSGKADESEPIIVNFGFVSDGTIFTQEYTSDESEGSYDATNVTKTKCATGDDVSYTFAVWTQLPQDETETEIGSRVYYKNFTLSSDSTRFGTTLLESGDLLGNAGDEESLSFDEGIPVFISDCVLVYDIDPANPPEDVYMPVSLLNTVVWEPTAPITRCELEGQSTVEFQMIKPALPSYRVPIETLKTTVEFKPDPDVKPDLIQEEFIQVFISDASVALEDKMPYDTYFVASASSEGFAEAEIVPEIEMYYGFNSLATFVDTDPEGDTEQPQDGLFEFNPASLDNITIFNIPVNADSLFTPMEPHIVELPYTVWVSPEPAEELPTDYPQDYFAREPYDLKVIVIPPRGGEVQVTTPDGVKNYDKGPEGTWQSSMAYDWVFDKHQEVTLTAIPAEGYRFVAWETDDFYTEIDDPHSPVLKLYITPPLKYSDMWTGTTIRAYFALVTEEPQDEPIPTLQETPYVSFEGRGQCTATQSSCSCNLAISIEGKDLTGGSYPVTNVTLAVNGDIWDDSGNISETHYTKTVERTVNCDMTFNIEVTATNSIGQIKSATGSVSTAR
jgi:hypothetical protein